METEEIRARLQCRDGECSCQTDSGNVHCPFPENHTNGDANPSLSIFIGTEGSRKGKLSFKCQSAGCDPRDIERIAGNVNGSSPDRDKDQDDNEGSEAAAEAGDGLTSKQLAEAKGLDYGFLEELSISDGVTGKHHTPCVDIPYFNPDGTPYRVKRRTSLEGGAKFYWKKSNKKGLIPYGLDRLDGDGHVIIVEGETDAITLLQQDIPALGIPGASSWKTAWMEHVKGREVYVWEEPDAGGLELVSSIIRDLPEARIIQAPPGIKDVNELWLRVNQDAEQFGEQLGALMAAAETREPARLEDSHRACTDLGNAYRLSDRHGNEMRHCREGDKWLVWTGTHWKRDTGTLADLRAFEVVHSIANEAESEPDEWLKKELKKWAKDSQSSGSVSAMLRLGRAMLPVEPDELDQNIWLLNCGNGTVDLSTGELRDHSRADYITKLIPTPYDREARAPRWEKFLEEIQPDPEVRAFLRRAVGYSLTGCIDEHVLFFLYGEGANGKNTFLDTLVRLLPGYAQYGAPNLINRKEGDHPTDIADLAGARFVIVNEVSGARLNEEFVKGATGDAKAKARRMREDFWEFVQTYKLWLMGNEKPGVKGQDYAIWRRIKMVPFTITFPEETRDLRLKEKLLEEAEGILVWAVEGRLEWQRIGGSRCLAIVEQATFEYKEEMDAVGQYLRECTKEPRTSWSGRGSTTPTTPVVQGIRPDADE